MNKKNWTEEEEKYILENFGKVTFNEMSKELNCSIGTIQNRLNFLGVVFNKKNRKRWAEEEYELLEKLTMVDKKTPKEIAEILSRTEDAIIIKISRRGLKIQTNDKRFWTKDEEVLLQDLWGSESFEVIAKKMNRTVSSI